MGIDTTMEVTVHSYLLLKDEIAQTVIGTNITFLPSIASQLLLSLISIFSWQLPTTNGTWCGCSARNSAYDRNLEHHDHRGTKLPQEADPSYPQLRHARCAMRGLS